MRKNLMKVAVLAGLGLVGQLAATDFRAPISTQLGPLHYSFDKLHKKKSNLTYFTTAHYRETNEAFISNGTTTHPLSQLIFGKSEFYVSDSFQDGHTWEDGLTQNLNPYLKTVKLAPRVSYTEAGVFFGGSWDYPVWQNKGRIGIRGSLPIRWVRMERDNEAEASVLGLQSDVIKSEIRGINPVSHGLPGNEPGVLNNVSSYRLALLRGMLRKVDVGQVVSVLQPFGDGGGVLLANVEYGSNDAKIYGTNTNDVPFVVIKSAKRGKAPRGQGGALLADVVTFPYNPSNDVTPDTRALYPNNGDITVNPYADSLTNVVLTPLAQDGSGPVANGELDLAGDRAAAFVAVAGTNYDKLFEHHHNNNLWATTIHGLNTDPIQTSKNAVDMIDQLLLNYSSDMEQWLADRGFVMTTDEQTDLGDIPVELFYEHSFNDNWRGELCVGVKFPTGNGGSDYSGNPFRVQMGNGSHWEIKLGALAAWQAIRCMNIKLDLSYNFALEKSEERKASYKGASIKNFGPKADANVDWGYFLGNLDFNFTHPKTKKINGMIGYQLYYKTEDHIDFKHDGQVSWLGQTWVQADGKTPADTEHAGTQWADVEMKLDGNVARMNTEQWANRIRLEGSYRLSKYCTTSVGGLYTFAGQNIPVDADVHCACQVNF